MWWRRTSTENRLPTSAATISCCGTMARNKRSRSSRWKRPARRPPRFRLTFNNRPGPGIAAVTVFLFDELNTKLTDQELAKKDFLRYLRGLPVASRVAVFVLGDSLSLLHDFSQDMASLLAAVAKHTNRVNPEVDASTAPPASAHSLTGDQKTTEQWDNFMTSSNQPYVDYAETARAIRTAAALETIAGHLQGIPGRGSGAGRGDRESCGAGRHRFHRASRSGGGGLQGVRDHRRAQHHAPTQGREVDRSLQFWWWWGRWSNLRRFH